MTLAIEVDDDAEAKRVFTALGVGGKSHDAFGENILDLLFRHADRQVWRAVDGECGHAHGVKANIP